MNGGVSIHTYFLEEYLRGNLELHIMSSSEYSEKTQEMELLTHGYTSMQNKLKHYLIESQRGKAFRVPGTEDIAVELAGDTAYRLVLETKKICVLRADAEDNEPVEQAIYNYITDDYEEAIQIIQEHSDEETNLVSHKWVYFYPKKDIGFNSLMSSAISLAGKELYDDKELNDDQQRHIRKLLTQKARKQLKPRQDLIRAAYRLKMTLDEMNLFLTKAAFTYALDFTDPWELRAAYLTVFEPVRDDDSPMIFDSKMKTLAGQGRGNGPTLASFLGQIKLQALDRWVRKWKKQESCGCGTAFLMEWSWYTYLHQNRQGVRKTTFYSKEFRQKAEDALSAIYQKLEKLVLEIPREQWLKYLLTDPYTNDFTDCLLDRHFQLLQLLYRHSAKPIRKKISFCIRNQAGEVVGSYVPDFREDGFTITLERNLRKVEDPERPLCRSDIISIGIELKLFWEEIDEALELAGFYKLYVKDIHERALIIVLRSIKQKNPLKDRLLQSQVLKQLEELYNELGEENQKTLRKAEPEWIRGLRENDTE